MSNLISSNVISAVAAGLASAAFADETTSAAGAGTSSDLIAAASGVVSFSPPPATSEGKLVFAADEAIAGACDSPQPATQGRQAAASSSPLAGAQFLRGSLIANGPLRVDRPRGLTRADRL